MGLRLHKAEFIRGVLVTKKNLLILCIDKNEAAMLDINLRSIKLHEL